MSVKSATALLDRMVTDFDFATQITKCRDFKECIAVAKAAGFDVAIEDTLTLEVGISDDELYAMLEGQ